MNGQEMMDCMGAMGAMGWAMWLFWGLLTVLAVWSLYRLFATSCTEAPARDAPLEALQHRYAEGEISTDEYEERKQRLERAK